LFANINNENDDMDVEQNKINLNLKNIYSFLSELDKMFTSNSVFTEDVPELKLYNKAISIYLDQQTTKIIEKNQ
jgi:hypothetical protein